MSDNDEPTDRRTEGVRIIGAQEAAEAAGRPDVVRRRRGGEKRYGDRPDTPEPASDLPKITISTTESDSHADRFGAVPVVQPGADSQDAEPRWSSGDDLPPAYGEHSERGGFGHARIVDDAPSAADAPDGGPVAADDTFDPATYEPDPSAYEPGSFDPASYEPGSFDPAAYEPGSFDPAAYEPGSVGGPDVESDTVVSAAAMDDPPGPGGRGALDDDGIDDDSFVLPHWTEPPTGQVPKVVIGEDAPEPEPLATYGSQPRWREEGERTSVTDFDDLADDGPALGALGSVEDDFFADGPYRDDDFVPEDADELEDDLEPAGDRRERPRGDRRAARPRPREDGAPPPSGGGDRPLGVAVGVGVGLVAIGLLCFWLGGLATTVLATVVVTIAAFEYFTAVRERGNNPATLLGIVAVAAMMIAAYAAALAAAPVVIGLTVMFGLLWYLWVAPGERSVQNLGLTLLGVLWIGFLGSFATLFLGLGRVLESAGGLDSNPGIGVLIAAVLVAVSHDVGAYFIGKYAGRTPLSAASPNKTQEGLIGGVLCSLVVTFVVVGLVGVSPIGDGLAQAFVFALLCALVAPLGDLCESFIKRDLGIKDMGTVLPGHGGVLDRFDALLFVLPVAYFVTVLFDIWGSVA
jgi:phosphatidate cytidylyltransferase